MRSAAHALPALLLAACSAASTPSDPGATGPYAVGFTSWRLLDTTRPGDGTLFAHRPVPVLVWYPVDAATLAPDAPLASYPFDAFQDALPEVSSSSWERQGTDRAYQAPRHSSAGPFPLVLFSHGYGTPGRVVGLATRLASHGLVVVEVQHFGDGSILPWYPAPTGFRRSFLDRPRDAVLALDDVLARNRSPGSLLEGVADPDRIAAAGFSLGGYAAMALAAGDDDVCDFPETPMASEFGPALPGDPCGQGTEPDPRIRAILPIDGSNQVLHIGELRRVAVPAMGIGEEWDSIGRNLPGDSSWQAREHALFSGPVAYRVDVRDTNHMASFGESCSYLAILRELAPELDADGSLTRYEAALCTNVTPWPVVRDVVGRYAVAFLKTHLAGETGYERWLAPEWTAANDPHAELFVRERVPAPAISSEWPADGTYYRHQADVP